MGLSPMEKKELVEKVVGNVCTTVAVTVPLCMFFYYCFNPAPVRLAKKALKKGQPFTLEPTK